MREPEADARNDDLRSAHAPEFTLQTWNCFGAAQGPISFLAWRGAPDSHRFDHPELHAHVHEADILCVQELYLGDAEDFFDRLEHGHKTRDPNTNTWSPFTVAGSGLGVAARFPIVARDLRPFGQPQILSERFARKGVLLVRLETHAGQVDLLTTHMQSGYSPKAQEIRAHQLQKVRRAIDEFGSPDRPFIVTGDFNICGLAPKRTGEYAALERVLGDFRDLGADADHVTFHPDPRVNSLAHRFEPRSPAQRVDYVMFRPDRSHRVEAVSTERVLERQLVGHGRETFASDHFGLRTRFVVR
ncbi:MAG: endonuclease/exonuclease/phosphatase family protein [Polyangiaceae bacterium]